MGAVRAAKFRARRTSVKRERGPFSVKDVLPPEGSLAALGHVGAARRGLILLPGFFIVDTGQLVPEPNNYARARSVRPR